MVQLGHCRGAWPTGLCPVGYRYKGCSREEAHCGGVWTGDLVGVPCQHPDLHTLIFGGVSLPLGGEATLMGSTGVVGAAGSQPAEPLSAFAG